jgi:hypothetical protein
MSDTIAWMVLQATQPKGYEIKGLPTVAYSKKK